MTGSSNSDSSLVFVVDDETDLGKIVASLLEIEGYQAAFFSDPGKALQAISTADRKPDLLVTDYVMTPMNGMELIHHCKSVAPEMPAILYSGNVGADITHLYVTKPDAFLEKPFLPQTLSALVASVLARRQD